MSEITDYTMLNLGISHRRKYGSMSWLLYVKAGNLTDKLAYNHSSFIERVAPLVGHHVTAGVRLAF